MATITHHVVSIKFVSFTQLLFSQKGPNLGSDSLSKKQAVFRVVVQFGEEQPGFSENAGLLQSKLYPSCISSLVVSDLRLGYF